MKALNLKILSRIKGLQKQNEVNENGGIKLN